MIREHQWLLTGYIRCKIRACTLSLANFRVSLPYPRVSPDQTMQYADPSNHTTYAIPPGTPVSTSTLLAHTHETVFPRPWTFDPDGWLGAAGQQRRKYMLAFSKGPRQCIGMHLADAELLVAIKAAVGWDMQLYETIEDEVQFLHDYHVATPRLDLRGVRARVVRKV
jgi:hypothetical protein